MSKPNASHAIDATDITITEGAVATAVHFTRRVWIPRSGGRTTDRGVWRFWGVITERGTTVARVRIAGGLHESGGVEPRDGGWARADWWDYTPGTVIIRLPPPR